MVDALNQPRLKRFVKERCFFFEESRPSWVVWLRSLTGHAHSVVRRQTLSCSTAAYSSPAPAFGNDASFDPAALPVAHAAPRERGDQSDRDPKDHAGHDDDEQDSIAFAVVVAVLVRAERPGQFVKRSERQHRHYGMTTRPTDRTV